MAVSEGSVVVCGDRLAVVESMKTELVVTAPCSGRVRQVLSSANVQVEAGAPLILIEAEDSGDEREAATPIGLEALSRSEVLTEGPTWSTLSIV